MNLRKKAAETLDGVKDASVEVQIAASLQTILVGIIGIAVIIAIALGLKGLTR